MTNPMPNSDLIPSATVPLRYGIRPTFRVSRMGAMESLSTRQISLLELLEVLHRERLEPAAWVAQYANEESGWYRLRLRQFANRLAKGTPWVEALEQTPDVLSDDQVLALRLASQSGTLDTAFASLRSAASSNPLESGSNWNSMLVYWCVVGAFLVGVLMIFESFISPTFRKIFHEMELATPANSLLQSVQMTLALRVGFITVGLLVFGILIGWSAPIRRWIRKWLRGKWLSPSLATTTAPVLRMLAIIAREGRPIVGALSTLAKYHSDSRIQQRLLLARNEMEQGASDWESLRISGLLSTPEQRALESCPEKRSQAWILEQLASKRESDSQHRRTLIEKCMHPAITLFFGGIVFWLAYTTIGSVYSLVVALS